MELINIGHENLVLSSRIVSIITPDSAPVKRMVQEARDTGRLIDASNGRKTQSVIITDSDHIILSGITPKQIQERLTEERV